MAMSHAFAKFEYGTGISRLFRLPQDESSFEIKQLQNILIISRTINRWTFQALQEVKICDNTSTDDSDDQIASFVREIHIRAAQFRP